MTTPLGQHFPGWHLENADLHSESKFAVTLLTRQFPCLVAYFPAWRNNQSGKVGNWSALNHKTMVHKQWRKFCYKLKNV
jgi:hypothetical protein